MGYWGNYGSFGPYVSVAERRRNAEQEVAKLKKKGRAITPIALDGKTIAKTFWGKAWCDNLERYADYESRIPRGKTYVRNGSVVHLEVGAGSVTALVSGSSLYEVSVSIVPLKNAHWRRLVGECAGTISSLVSLLKGQLGPSVMALLVRPREGLFPSPDEIDFRCSCPDSAYMCKHIAAVLYGVGARLDEQPDLFFQLRKVDPTDLLSARASAGATLERGQKTEVAGADLSSLFGIDLDESALPADPGKPTRAAATRPKKPTRKPATDEAAEKTKPARARSIEAASTPRKKTARASVGPAREVSTVVRARPRPERPATLQAIMSEAFQAKAFAAVKSSSKTASASRSTSRSPLKSKPQAGSKSRAREKTRERTIAARRATRDPQ